MDFRSLGLAEGAETDCIAAFLAEARNSAGEPGAAPDSPMEVALPPGDDAAALRQPAGDYVVASSDSSVEGIHFRREWMTWETIGYRAAAAALSDLAAMAAAPAGLVISLAIPPELGINALTGLGRGIGQVAGRTGSPILGGDLVASPGPVFCGITVLGHAASPATRRGARPGDELWVTGELGAAAAALRAFERSEEPDAACRAAFERPAPRIAEALWLMERAGLRAAIDISDGLLGDARHLAAASRVGLEIDASSVPAPASLAGFCEMPPRASLVLAGGEDYEILIAVETGSLSGAVKDFRAAFGLGLTRIGRVVEGEGVALSGVAEPEVGGFDHFASSAARGAARDPLGNQEAWARGASVPRTDPARESGP